MVIVIINLLPRWTRLVHHGTNRSASGGRSALAEKVARFRVELDVRDGQVLFEVPCFDGQGPAGEMSSPESGDKPRSVPAGHELTDRLCAMMGGIAPHRRRTK